MEISAASDIDYSIICDETFSQLAWTLRLEWGKEGYFINLLFYMCRKKKAGGMKN